MLSSWNKDIIIIIIKEIKTFAYPLNFLLKIIPLSGAL